MPYWYTRFGTTDLPLCNASQDLGMGPAATAYSEYPYSVYDALGAEQAQVKVPYTLKVEATINNLNPVILQTDFYAYRALLGQRALLYRVRDRLPGSIESVMARLAQFTTRRDSNSPTSLELSFEFDILKGVWDGTAHSETVTLATSPKTVTLVNNGNAIQRQVAITVNAGPTTPMAAIKIENLTTGHVSSFTYTSNIAVNMATVFDCGAATCRYNGTDDFNDFALDAAHTINEWLRLAPGNNSIRITRTDGNVDSTVVFTYNDAWA